MNGSGHVDDPFVCKMLYKKFKMYCERRTVRRKNRWHHCLPPIQLEAPMRRFECLKFNFNRRIVHNFTQIYDGGGGVH